MRNGNYRCCPVCGRWYAVHSMYCGPQDVCGPCAAARQAAVGAPDTPEQEQRRKKTFGRPVNPRETSHE